MKVRRVLVVSLVLSVFLPWVHSVGAQVPAPKALPPGVSRRAVLEASLEKGEGVKSFVDSPASSHGRESGKLYFIGGKTCEGRVLTNTINSQQKI